MSILNYTTFNKSSITIDYFIESGITTVSMSLSQIRPNLFQEHPTLISAIFPNCTSIGDQAFAGCKSLITLSFPECISIGNHAFRDIGATSLSFPKCTFAGSWAFGYCYSLTNVNLPECVSIGDCAFGYCYSLTNVNLPECVSIGDAAFLSCYNLLSLYLTGSSVATLADTYAFYNTPISTYTASTNGQYGSIYVPASLIDTYKTAQNWSVYADRFVAI